MADLSFNINVSGMPEIFAKVTQAVRTEVSRLMREKAASETNLAVSARLMEIEAEFNEGMSAAEASARVESAPVTGTPRMGQVLAGGKK